MKLEGTNLLGTASETAFLTGENARSLPFFAATSRYMNADAENGLPDSVLYPRHFSQKTFYLFESNTRMAKEVNP